MNKETQKKLSLLWRFLRGSKRFFLLSILFASTAAAADMLIPQIVRFAIDNVIGGKPGALPSFLEAVVLRLGGLSVLKQNLWILALAIVAVALLKVMSQYCFCVFNAKGAETLSKSTRDQLFSHIIRLPYSWHRKNQTGDIIQRCTSDIATMNEFVTEELAAMFQIVVLLCAALIFMLNMHVPLTFIAISIFPLIMLNSILFDRKIEKNFQRFDEEEGKLSSMVQENLTGVRVVRAFGQEKRELSKFGSQNAHVTDIGKDIGEAYGGFFCTSDILSGLQVMIVIVFGAVFCIKGSMTPGEYIAFISYNTMLAWPLNELGRIITGLGKTSVSIDRIRYIMESPVEENPEKALKPDLNQDISFDHVTFSYGDSAPVLEDVSFTMKAGSTLGILGGTGSGKSTLMLLLDKIYSLPENGGKITIGGVDIRDMDTGYLRKNVGIVLQDPYLFSRTIRENIGIADDSLSEETIQQAAENACLTKAIESFAKGYETLVGERGVTLSGGQKQRVAIARILTQDTPIMIFDDSLSAVDTETDAKIRSSLEKRFGSASILLISHRISTLSKADKIIVLDDGRIAQQGTHEELIAQEGIYRTIYEIQTKGKEKSQ